MNEEPEITRPLSPEPEKPKPSPAGEEDTGDISLIDLMNQVADENDPAKPLVIKEEDLPPDDQATPTGPIVLPNPEDRQPPPASPPAPPPRHRTISARPPQRDPDATRVQPRVAFPGSTDPQAKRVRPPQQRPRRSRSSDTGEILPPPQNPPLRERDVRPRSVRPRPQSHQARDVRPRPGTQPPRRQPPPPPAQPRVVVQQQQQPDPAPLPQAQPKPKRNWRGCITRTIAIISFLLIVGGALGLVASFIGYVSIANDLPSAAELEASASNFETAVIYDRNGNILYSLADPTTGNRTYVTVDRISPHLINATIATEDARFYSNPGFDPIGIARAIVQAAQEREFVSGASTITQQLVRALLLDDDERTERTFRRKVREIILAEEISRTYDKDTILELYLNEIYYGNLAYGIEAASQTYFNKSAAELTLAEASLLAGLPQTPALYDPFTAPEIVLGRQQQVLTLMVQEGYITPQDAQLALDESANTIRNNLTPPTYNITHPHFVFTVLQQLETEGDPQAIYRGGFQIFTTLDPSVQELASDSIAANRPNFNSLGANNAAFVAIDPATGEILALVGSADFNDDDIRGQVNMALTPRQPGSSIKPLVYLAAMEHEAPWTPSTLIWDVRTEFPDNPNPPYVPKNFDDEFHGPLLLRESLGNSYNITAVKALEYVGVCDFITRMQDLGMTALLDDGCSTVGQPSQSGLSLSLGGREVSPLAMAGAYSALANQGVYMEPFSIRRIENSQGEVLFEYVPPNPADRQIVRQDHAFLLSNILSDNNARQPEFGVNNNLVIPGHAVAAKTGTSGTSSIDVRDGWTIGYTPQIVAAVWVGNTDASPVGDGVSGYRLASPIWRQFMTNFLANRQPLNFLQPANIVQLEICADSGTRPGANCPDRRLEYFAADQLPLDANQDFLQRLPIDLWTNQIANEFCQDSVFQANFVNLLVSGNSDVRQRELISARQWVEQTARGQRWAQDRNIGLPLQLPPNQSCSQDSARPSAIINNLSPDQEVTGEIEIRGSALGPSFAGYEVQFGLTHDPGGWASITGRVPNQVNNDLLARWDTTSIEADGQVTVRLLVFGSDNPYTSENDPVVIERRVTVRLLQPTVTVTPTPTETVTPTATGTDEPTATATATEELPPTPTATEEAGGIPTITPTPEPIDTLTPTPPPPAEGTPSPTPTAISPTETATPSTDE